MTIEINLLKAFSIKENLMSYRHLVNTKTLSIQSIEILKDYLIYFEQYEKEDKINFNKFNTFFFIERHPNLDEKSISQYKEVFRMLAETEYSSVTNLIASFEQQEFYNQLQTSLDKNEDINIIKERVSYTADKINAVKGLKIAQEEEMDLKEALAYTDRSKGIQWRLQCLRDHFNGGLIKGDFGIVAGFVDMGKTGFLCSEISYMAEQLEGDQYIAWLNTEGTWQSIIPRIYCATLNCTFQDLNKWPDKAIEKYTERMKGNKNRIKVLNFQRKSTKDVENLIKNNPPSLIVFDLLDAIVGYEKYINGESGSHERYGQLYQWARTIATENCPVLAISQLNGDGNNSPYPSVTGLRGSRVDKQAAATFQLIIGGMEGNSTERYLSMPKNKINGNKGWRCQVKFDPLRSRFND